MMLTALANLLIVLFYILRIYLGFMLVVCILSWIPAVYSYRWYHVLRNISDFYLGRFRGWIVIGPLDFTPVIGFLIYEFALEVLATRIIPMVI